ncbi:MAG: OsmC family protein [Gemmatimonadaceae bacterium]
MSEERSSHEVDASSWVTATIGLSGFRTEVSARSHAIVADEPLPLGGTDLGPTPYEFLLTALATCTVITLRMYADRKQWPLASASVSLRSSRSHERDCEDCETKKVDIGRIESRIDLGGPISEEQRARLIEIAGRCPVKQTLERGITVELVLRRS